MIADVLYVLLAMVLLGVIITVHEFGHYLAGRLCGIGILKFSIGFGPKLISWERNGIEYMLRAIPLGGYCAFVGEDDFSDDPRAMSKQPVWKRFLTVFAGPFMNFVLAFVACLVMLHCYEIAETLPVLQEVTAGMPAEAAGLLPGDVIESIDGAPVAYSGRGVSGMVAVIQAATPGDTVELGILRGDEKLTIALATVAQVDEASGVRHGQIGIAFGGRTYTVPESIRYAGKYMVYTMGEMLRAFRRLFFHGEGLDQVTGTVGVIAVVSKIARDGFDDVLWLIFILSQNIGLVNLLPLPALDGGRLVFLILEKLRGKPVPPDKEGLVHGIGLILVLALFVFLTFRDVSTLVTAGVNGFLS